jgi:hypothetical protein
MGFRKILILEKPVDVKLNETKKSCLGSRESYHASKIKTTRNIARLYSRVIIM